jgi:hypothetical protein
MQFQVTQIEFDFDDAQEYIPEEDKQEVYNDVIGAVWEADDEDDLIEEITCATGWCINSIDYRHVLN